MQNLHAAFYGILIIFCFYGCADAPLAPILDTVRVVVSDEPTEELGPPH